MKFTKEQRMEAYTYALLMVLSGRGFSGVCNHLINFAELIGIYENFFDFDLKDFPEFLMQKPKVIDRYGYWFKSDQGRIYALCCAIELLEQKSE